MKNRKDEIIDMLVKLNPFKINCDGGKGCVSGIKNEHPAVWFVALSCGCIHVACQAAREATERVFRHGTSEAETSVCIKCQVSDITVQYYQPVPSYADTPGWGRP
jgi:hypothetical protein